MLHTCGNNRLITASLPVSDSHCDHGYLLYGDFCYKFVTESVSNWNDAEAQCQRDQAHLASFHSEEELSFITGEQPGKTRKVSKRHPFKKKKELQRFLLSAAHLPAAAWIGLNDISNENHFVYTDGTPAVSHLTSAAEFVLKTHF